MKKYATPRNCMVSFKLRSLCPGLGVLVIPWKGGLVCPVAGLGAVVKTEIPAEDWTLVFQSCYRGVTLTEPPWFCIAIRRLIKLTTFKIINYFQLVNLKLLGKPGFSILMIKYFKDHFPSRNFIYEFAHFLVRILRAKFPQSLQDRAEQIVYLHLLHHVQQFWKYFEEA
jgi:hypothetical protein